MTTAALEKLTAMRFSDYRTTYIWHSIYFLMTLIEYGRKKQLMGETIWFELDYVFVEYMPSASPETVSIVLETKDVE